MFGKDTSYKEWRENIHPDDVARVEEIFATAVENSDDAENYRITYRAKNNQGHYIWINSIFKCVHHEDGRMDMLTGMDTDVTEEYERDTVTNGTNYRGFIRRAEELLSEVEDKSAYAVLYFNLKNFKAFNELHNRMIGNRLLKSYYEYLESSPLGCLAMGRSEDHFFCLVKYHEGILEQIEELCEFTFKKDKRNYFVYGNCGIYCLQGEEHKPDITQLIDKAKLAKDSLTSDSAYSYAFYEENIRDSYISDAIALSELNKAIEEEQFKIFYQPIVATESGKVASSEALIRWQHPEMGSLSPDKFVFALEKQGYLSRLDGYVVRQVGRFYKERLEKKLPLVPISINISWVDFQDEDYLQEINNLVDILQGHTELLRFEITESSFVKLDERLEGIINDLRHKGATFLIDDFGTGYSSYSMLQSFNFDILKIDMGFSRKIGINKKTNQLVLSIIEMSHQLGIKCVAEGVENIEQLNFYKEHGCEYIQGYYFYKPLQAEEYGQLLDNLAQQDKLVDTKLHAENVPVSFYRGSVYFADHDMYRIASASTGQVYELLAKNYGVGAISGLYDENRSICYFTNLFLCIMQCTYEEFMEYSKGSFLNIVAPEDRSIIMHNSSMEQYFSLLLRDGTRLPVASVLAFGHTTNGKRQWIAAIRRRDYINEDNQAQIDNMRVIAERDTFTNLLNKTPFFTKMENQLKAQPKAICALMMVDLDNFKTINDMCGHAEGDRVLLYVARLLDNAFHVGDLVGRFGGDEFVVFIKNAEDLQQLRSRAAYILQKVERELYFEQLERSATVSIGITTGLGSVGVTDFFEQADKALYQAKADGKNCYRVYEKVEAEADILDKK